MPIVLDVACEEAFPYVDGMGLSRSESIELDRIIVQKIRHCAVRAKTSVRTQLFHDVVLHVLESESQFDGMSTAADERVVVHLVRRPAMQELIKTAQTDRSRKSRH